MIWVAIMLIVAVTMSLIAAFLSVKASGEFDETAEKIDILIQTTAASVNGINKRLDDTIEKANANDIRLNNMATRNKLDIARANKQIDDIIIKLQEITADIHRLDHDEKEIRSYYVNFREPKFDNAGVEWSEEYVTHDD